MQTWFSVLPSQSPVFFFRLSMGHHTMWHPVYAVINWTSWLSIHLSIFLLHRVKKQNVSIPWYRLSFCPAPVWCVFFLLSQQEKQPRSTGSTNSMDLVRVSQWECVNPYQILRALVVLWVGLLSDRYSNWGAGRQKMWTRGKPNKKKERKRKYVVYKQYKRQLSNRRWVLDAKKTPEGKRREGKGLKDFENKQTKKEKERETE